MPDDVRSGIVYLMLRDSLSMTRLRCFAVLFSALLVSTTPASVALAKPETRAAALPQPEAQAAGFSSYVLPIG